MLGFNQPLMISVMAVRHRQKSRDTVGPGRRPTGPSTIIPVAMDYDRSDRASCQFLPDGRTYDGGLPLDLVPDVASFQSRRYR